MFARLVLIWLVPADTRDYECGRAREGLLSPRIGSGGGHAVSTVLLSACGLHAARLLAGRFVDIPTPLTEFAMQTMKAVVFRGPNNLRIEEIEKPQPRARRRVNADAAAYFTSQQQEALRAGRPNRHAAIVDPWLSS